ncbi:MAG: hypothetical protein U0T69_10645 [Chitinophagales bacterium]
MENFQEQEIQVHPETVQRLNDLLVSLNIKEAYYIDDYNKIDDFPNLSARVNKLFEANRTNDLQNVFGNDLNLELPDSDQLSEEFSKIWEEYGEDKKAEVIIKIHQIEDEDFNSVDYTRTKQLESIFPKDLLRMVNPDEWDELFDSLSGKLSADDRVLLIFDQDLKNAKGERFKNGTIKGQNLIIDVKKSAIKDKVYCALITHLITTTSAELIGRDDIITELGNGLAKKDFLALSKSRINSPEMFCDGIKKTILNEYFEEIKEKSEIVLVNAHANAMKIIEKLDTYDFDHTVLRSSYGEGVWEVDTLLRIAKNIYDEEIKKAMIDTKYSEFINPYLKKSKPISDIRFRINSGIEPYVEKYTLRHNDIYESGHIINNLHLPIENGDIFEVTEGTGKGCYILVAQECDLMMRTTPMGSRTTEMAMVVLLKIKEFTRDDLDIKIKDYYTNNGMGNHFFANKFKLEYYKKGTTDIGVVNFNDPFLADLNPLDLCVFSTNGEAKTDLDVAIDPNVLSIAWDERYKKLNKECVKIADKLDKANPEIDKADKSFRDYLRRGVYPKISTRNLGNSKTYDNRKFNFGIKRIMRLKPLGAKYLLDRYYKHLSRIAEPHDFASSFD